MTRTKAIFMRHWKEALWLESRLQTAFFFLKRRSVGGDGVAVNQACRIAEVIGDAYVLLARLQQALEDELPAPVER